MHRRLAHGQTERRPRRPYAKVADRHSLTAAVESICGTRPWLFAIGLPSESADLAYPDGMIRLQGMRMCQTERRPEKPKSQGPQRSKMRNMHQQLRNGPERAGLGAAHRASGHMVHLLLRRVAPRYPDSSCLDPDSACSSLLPVDPALAMAGEEEKDCDAAVDRLSASRRSPRLTVAVR